MGGCGCGKKKGPGIALGGFKEDSLASGEPEDWGPQLWFILHYFSIKIGKIPELIGDYRQGMKMIIDWLPTIIPCTTCQEHCKLYLSANSTEYWATISDMDTLKAAIQTWLIDFHNAVRTRKGQPIIITTLADLATEYDDKTLEECRIKTVADNVLFGIRTGKVKMDQWKRWLKQFNTLKIMLSL